MFGNIFRLRHELQFHIEATSTKRYLHAEATNPLDSTSADRAFNSTIDIRTSIASTIRKGKQLERIKVTI